MQTFIDPRVVFSLVCLTHPGPLLPLTPSVPLSIGRRDNNHFSLFQLRISRRHVAVVHRVDDRGRSIVVLTNASQVSVRVISPARHEQAKIPPKHSCMLLPDDVVELLYDAHARFAFQLVECDPARQPMSRRTPLVPSLAEYKAACRTRQVLAGLGGGGGGGEGGADAKEPPLIIGGALVTATSSGGGSGMAVAGAEGDDGEDDGIVDGSDVGGGVEEEEEGGAAAPAPRAHLRHYQPSETGEEEAAATAAASELPPLTYEDWLHLLPRILSFLSVPDLARAACTCVDWARTVRQGEGGAAAARAAWAVVDSGDAAAAVASPRFAGGLNRILLAPLACPAGVWPFPLVPRPRMRRLEQPLWRWPAAGHAALPFLAIGRAFPGSIAPPSFRVFDTFVSSVNAKCLSFAGARWVSAGAVLHAMGVPLGVAPVSDMCPKQRWSRCSTVSATLPLWARVEAAAAPSTTGLPLRPPAATPHQYVRWFLGDALTGQPGAPLPHDATACAAAWWGRIDGAITLPQQPPPGGFDAGRGAGVRRLVQAHRWPRSQAAGDAIGNGGAGEAEDEGADGAAVTSGGAAAAAAGGGTAPAAPPLPQGPPLFAPLEAEALAHQALEALEHHATELARHRFHPAEYQLPDWVFVVAYLEMSVALAALATPTGGDSAAGGLLTRGPVYNPLDSLALRAPSRQRAAALDGVRARVRDSIAGAVASVAAGAAASARAAAAAVSSSSGTMVDCVNDDDVVSKRSDDGAPLNAAAPWSECDAALSAAAAAVGRVLTPLGGRRSHIIATEYALAAVDLYRFSVKLALEEETAVLGGSVEHREGNDPGSGVGDTLAPLYVAATTGVLGSGSSGGGEAKDAMSTASAVVTAAAADVAAGFVPRRVLWHRLCGLDAVPESGRAAALKEASMSLPAVPLPLVGRLVSFEMPTPSPVTTWDAVRDDAAALADGGGAAVSGSGGDGSSSASRAPPTHLPNALGPPLPVGFASAITSLDLSGCVSIHPANMPLIVSFAPGLKSLNLSACTQLTPGAVAATVMAAPDLEELKLDFLGDAVTDDVLEVIGRHLRKLKRLSLAGCYRLTDAGFGALGQTLSQPLPSCGEGPDARLHDAPPPPPAPPGVVDAFPAFSGMGVPPVRLTHGGGSGSSESEEGATDPYAAWPERGDVRACFLGANCVPPPWAGALGRHRAGDEEGAAGLTPPVPDGWQHPQLAAAAAARTATGGGARLHPDAPKVWLRRRLGEPSTSAAVLLAPSPPPFPLSAAFSGAAASSGYGFGGEAAGFGWAPTPVAPSAPPADPPPWVDLQLCPGLFTARAPTGVGSAFFGTPSSYDDGSSGGAGLLGRGGAHRLPLRCLNLRGCTGITDATFHLLAATCPDLSELIAAGTTGASPHGYADVLLSLRRLKVLRGEVVMADPPAASSSAAAPDADNAVASPSAAAHDGTRRYTYRLSSVVSGVGVVLKLLSPAHPLVPALRALSSGSAGKSGGSTSAAVAR